MRALCGAIITAGSLIGLGLFGIGFGLRYQTVPLTAADKTAAISRFHQMDTPMLLCLILLVIALVVGMIIAFIGLAYHHHRRHHELQHTLHGHAAAVPPATRI